MAQRDYEEQPEAPDLGASVQLESEEADDGEETGADRIDRAPESGGAAAGASGRQDAGPDAWR
jgi:hypothetical protein